MVLNFKNLPEKTKTSLFGAAYFGSLVAVAVGTVYFMNNNAVNSNIKGIEDCLDPVVGHSNLTYFNKYGTNSGKVDLKVHDTSVELNFSGKGGFPPQKYELVYTHIGLFDTHDDEYNYAVAKAINEHLTDSSGKFNSEYLEGQFWDGSEMCSPWKFKKIAKEREKFLESKRSK